MTFEIWEEGYVATGESAKARHKEDLVDGYVVREVRKAKKRSRRFREREKA